MPVFLGNSIVESVAVGGAPVLIGDDDLDDNGVNLDSHIPSGIGIGGWEYNGDSSQFSGASGGMRNNEFLNQTDATARTTNDFQDDLIEIFGDCWRTSVDTTTRRYDLFLCAHSIEPLNFFNTSGIDLIVTRTSADTVLVRVRLYDNNFILFRTVNINTSLTWAADTGLRLGLIKILDVVTVYTEPYGGGTRVVEGTVTLTSPERTLYEDGSHKRVAISLGGRAVGGAARMDHFSVFSTSGGGSSTPTGIFVA